MSCPENKSNNKAMRISKENTPALVNRMPTCASGNGCEMRFNRCFGGSVTCGAKFLIYPLASLVVSYEYTRNNNKRKALLI